MLKEWRNTAMEIKSLSIGRLSTKNNILLAPLAGFTDFAFRQICYEAGAGLCFSEMVSCKGLKYNSENTRSLLKTTDSDYIKAVQLFGSDPEIMAEICKSEDLKKFDIIDINMGCPVPKVFNNGEGCKLMADPVLAGELISAAKESGKEVTVKMRLGIEKGVFLAEKLAVQAEKSGASLITVHGRYRDDYYSGICDFEKIKRVTESVSVPVIANGGIFTKDDADICMEKTGAAGVMLARGALNRPWLFSEISGKTVKDKKSIVKRHIDLLLTEYSDKYVAINMRKQMALYLSGVKDAKKYKIRAFEATTTKELKAIINELNL